MLRGVPRGQILRKLMSPWPSPARLLGGAIRWPDVLDLALWRFERYSGSRLSQMLDLPSGEKERLTVGEPIWTEDTLEAFLRTPGVSAPPG